MSGLNEYINKCRANYHEANDLKKKNQRMIAKAIRLAELHPVKERVYILYKWYEPNMRRDLDNISFAKKFINDALVKEGILANDGWKEVGGLKDEFYVDKKNPRIEVYLYNEFEFKMLVG